jgi:peptide/nickel transport system permease protein
MTDTARLDHYVAKEPFDPYSIERVTPEQERFYLASQWRMIWLKFRRHRIAVVSGLVLLAMYGAILVVEVLAPYNLHTRNVDHIYVPPQRVHYFHQGGFVGPFVYDLDYRLDMTNLRRVYTENTQRPMPIRFFCKGDRYRFWSMAEGDFHLFCPPEDGTLFLLGSDRLGRDLLSRILYGMRISLTIGLFGVAVSFVLGMGLGGLAGYYGGWVDDAVQRVIEVLRSIPHLPLWLALAAILPVTWSPLLVCFGITIILGLIDWTGLARSSLASPLPARGGFLRRGAIDGGDTGAHHLPAPDAKLHEPPHRLGHPRCPLDDPGRNGALVPRTRHPGADHLLGRPPQRGAEHQRGRALSLADAAHHPGDRGGAGLQLFGRWLARRRRSLSVRRSLSP